MAGSRDAREALRREAADRTLFAPTDLAQALERFGFVQAAVEIDELLILQMISQ